MKTAREKLIKSVFKSGFIQDVLTFLTWCEKNNISIDDVKNTINADYIKKEANFKFCPLCGKNLEKYKLPDDVFNHKMILYCKTCDHERLY